MHMGIIIKQTIKGTVWSYAGVVLGFITTAVLFPEYLEPEVIGLFGVLVSYATLLGRFALLGLPGVTGRLFAYFRNDVNNHNGFVFLAFLFQILGAALFLTAFFILKPWLTATNIQSSPLFVEYLYLLIPMTLAMMLFTFLDTYNKVLYDAVFGTFLQEFLQRLLILAVTLLFIFQIITLNQLIVGYAAAFSLKALFILLLLLKRKEIRLKPSFTFITKKLRKEIISVASFSLLSGLGSMIVFKLDKIIINQMLDLGNTGVYTIAFYFGSLIIMPSRPFLKISGTLIADAWKNKDIETIQEIYYKSCLNQFIIGGFLFLGIWANIDNILTLLGPVYEPGKWVIFFVGLGYLIDMSTGANGPIINFSRYYRLNLLFIILLIAFVVIFMILFIPIWGITGASIALTLALLLNNLMRFWFLYKKYNLQPFNVKFIFVFAFFMGVYLLQELLPQSYYIFDIILRSTLITLATFFFFRYFNISGEITKLIQDIQNKLRTSS